MGEIRYKSSMRRRERPLGGAFGVAENIRLLQRYAYIEEMLMKLQAAWLIAIPEWDLKLALARHLYEDAEHVQWLRNRIQELRGGRPDGAVDPALAEVLDEALHGEDTMQFLLGTYAVLKKCLLKQYQQHIALTDPLLDAPTVRVLEFIVHEEEQQQRWLQDELLQLECSAEIQNGAERWAEYVEQSLKKVGGITGSEPWDESDPHRPTEHRFILPASARREDRYARCCRRNDPPSETDEYQLIWQFRHHRDEMQATEIFASVLYETNDMPWEFLHDVARHCWDESRHCLMGQQRLQEMGLEMTDFPVMTGNIEFQLTHLDPLQRYALTTLEDERVEMPNKKIKYERAIRLIDPVSAICTDYDWSDEINHVRYGKKWVPQMLWKRSDLRSVEELMRQCNQLAETYFRHQPPG